MQEALEKVKTSEFWQANRTQLRPWALFFNTQRIRIPRSEEYMLRLRRNLAYYQANYVCSAIGLLAVFILVEPSFLIGLLLIAASYYYLLYQKNPISLGGKVLNETERMVAFIALTSVNLWLFSVGADIFYLIFIISFAILTHASIFEAFDEDFGFDKQFGTDFGRSGV